MKNLVADIRAALTEVARPEDAGPMARYMKDIAPFLGVKAPARKLVEREVFALHKTLPFPEVCAAVGSLWAQPEREFQYVAMDWLDRRRKDYTPETGALLEELLTTKSWWDTVDTLSAHPVAAWAKAFPEAAAPVIRRWISAPNMWLNRAAIIHQLTYGKGTDTMLLTDAILPHAASKEFFHQKAIGWALRQYGRTNPDWVIAFVDTHPLAALSKREALRRI